jgi:hypothetical protein
MSRSPGTGVSNQGMVLNRVDQGSRPFLLEEQLPEGRLVSSEANGPAPGLPNSAVIDSMRRRWYGAHGRRGLRLNGGERVYAAAHGGA